MSRTPTPILLVALALAAALCGGCERRESRPRAKKAERGPEFFASALASLDQAQDIVRREVLATWDKWHHLAGDCDEEQVRRDQLECWIDKGAPLQKYVDARNWRPRQRAARLLLEVNVCMEQRGWRKVSPGRDF
jgi:hypothetical protein